MLSSEELTAWYERLNFSLRNSFGDRPRAVLGAGSARGRGPRERERALSESEDGHDHPV